MEPEDRLLIVDLCPRCAGNVYTRNHIDDWEEPEPSFLIYPALPSVHAPVDEAEPEEP